MSRSIIDTLTKWRNYPSYQLERRVDWLFGLLLKRGLCIEIKDTVIPEYPICRRRGNDTDQSDRVDFVAFGKNDGEIYLIEIKTDDASFDNSQIEHYTKQTRGSLVKQFVRSWIGTDERPKYYYLLKRMVEMEMMKLESNLIQKESWHDMNKGEKKRLTQTLAGQLEEEVDKTSVKVFCITPTKRRIDGVTSVSIVEFIDACARAEMAMSEDEKIAFEMIKGIHFGA